MAKLVTVKIARLNRANKRKEIPANFSFMRWKSLGRGTGPATNRLLAGSPFLRSLKFPIQIENAATLGGACELRRWAGSGAVKRFPPGTAFASNVHFEADESLGFEYYQRYLALRRARVMGILLSEGGRYYLCSSVISGNVWDSKSYITIGALRDLIERLERKAS